MSADQRTEFKFKDATDSEAESVKLVTPDATPEELASSATPEVGPETEIRNRTTCLS